ncbi:siderophore-interacting protein [Actinoplanes sp. LDG1-06]|uniref:Siderophore-interacting protein n=1 Tax=Paractinoplanes ovalisporus TaxID=2810368 RepID=A0ABS2AKA6_9ACTN|nr:siderophore-interacting protein [Actinoplanes ovalisporus]MBM2620246.1 siderophore-interacting protein [Actinoplanes ovalisporus]
MTQTVDPATSTVPWRFFATEVRAVRRLSPHFVRVTFTGDDLDCFADNGFDQRIKLIPPLPGSGLAHLPTGEDWYTEWRELPEERRNPIRTYTVRAVRPELREVDVDMVLHGIEGPASKFAAEAGPGTPAYLMGPNARFDGLHGGIDFHPPAHAECLLLGGDETAVPAIASILERLPADARGEALLEAPSAEDAQQLTAPEGVRITWLARDGGVHGDKLIPAVRAATRRIFGEEQLGPAVELEDVDVDHDVLWEVPEEVVDVSRFYAWLAGEVAMIKKLRRHLVAECGVDRKLVAFMGYWRLGRAEGS